MENTFDAVNIDNNAIEIVTNQLRSFLNPDGDSEFLKFDDQNTSGKHRILYEEIYLPYCRAKMDHFNYHHNDCVVDSWCGEQVCLSIIHLINQKAWWLIHCFAIEELIEKYCDDPEEDDLKEISRHTARCILDGDMTIKDAVNNCISGKIGLESDKEELLIGELSHKIAEFKEVPSLPMYYR